MEIRVVDTERRRNGSDSYVAFNIETKCAEKTDVLPAGVHDTWRRFSEFLALRNYLSTSYPAVVLPCLPPKNPLTQKTADVVEKRKNGLQLFLRRCARHPSLSKDDYFARFLYADDWVPVKNQTQSEGIFNMKSKPKEPNLDILQKETSALEFKKLLQSYLVIVDFVRKRATTMADLYARDGEAIEKWGVLEKDMGSAIEKLGSFMGKESSFLIAKVQNEDEELYDIIHEYELIMDSVVDVVKEYVNRLSLSEKQQQTLAAKQKELADLEAQQGVAPSGFTSFFKKQTPEQLNQKISFCKFQCEEETKKTQQSDADMEDYTKLVTSELQFFEENKIAEFKQIFINFTKIQIKFYEEDLARWQALQTEVISQI